MMVYAIDDNNDWLFGLNELGFMRSKEAVKQCVKTRLQCFKNDWYLAIDDGVDWFALLEQKNKNNVANAVYQRALSTQGVKKIGKFDQAKMHIDIESIFARSKDTVKINIT